MGKIRRSGYVFLAWKSDHVPWHVHVYRDERMIVKWDMENGKAMKGSTTARILSIIEQLRSEGRL